MPQRISARRIHRSARASQRALRRDLEAFSSPRELAELSAILDRHQDSDAAPVRDAIDWTPRGSRATHAGAQN